MATESMNPRGPSRALHRTKVPCAPETLTPDEAFLDDIRVSLQEIETGDVVDSRQRIPELRAQLKDAKDDCQATRGGFRIAYHVGAEHAVTLIMICARSECRDLDESRIRRFVNEL